MTTAIQIVEGAAEEIGVKTAEIPLEAGDYSVIFERMNDMLSEWAYDGVAPEFVPVVNSTDEVLIARHGVAAAKYNLALRCAPAFQRPVSQALATMADDSLAAFSASAIFVGETAYPDSLPKGSGNRRCGWGLSDDTFFPTNKKENF